MKTDPQPWRARALSLLLALLVALSGTPAALAGQTQNSLAARVSGQSAQEESLRPLTEAYVLLLDRYAVPLDPVALAEAAQVGLDEALAEAGLPATRGLGTVGNEPAQLLAGLRFRIQALAARYGDKLSESDLLGAAISGMAAYTDDAHTNFVTAQQYQEHLRWRGGEVSYGGIGARMRGPAATVVEVFPGSPAERAGLQPGDTIVAVDGQPVEGWRLDEIITLVRGEEGTPVVLAVERAGGARVDELRLARARVAMPFVQSRRMGDFGHVQLRGFPEPSVVDGVVDAITRLQNEGVRGIIFDLRGNGGGRVDVGSALLSRFVPEGPIYQAVDRRGRQDVINVQNARPLLTVPLVVLIDEGTASMGEVFAAAVLEHGVGHLIGTTTSGAVAASVYVPLSDGSALQLSVEQVYTGGGALLDKVGVTPNEVVELDLDLLRQGTDVQLQHAVEHLRVAAANRAPVASGAR
jgi:carboxyl-terminal processing protease